MTANGSIYFYGYKHWTRQERWEINASRMNMYAKKMYSHIFQSYILQKGKNG